MEILNLLNWFFVQMQNLFNPVYTQAGFEQTVSIFSLVSALPIFPQVIGAIRANKEEAKKISIIMFGFYTIYMIVLAILYLQINQQPLFYSAITIFVQELIIVVVICLKRFRK